MGPIFSWIFSNLFSIVITVFIVVFIIRQIKKGNIRIQRTDGAVTPMVTGAARPEDASEKDYNGNTGGIAWSLKSIVRYQRPGRDSKRVFEKTGEAWKRKSTWRTPEGAWPNGKFLLFMSTPGFENAKPMQEGGFVNNMINYVADMALDLYVGSYFGNEYKDLVNLKSGTKLERSELKDFFIFTNDATTANRFLDDATAQVIAAWKQQKSGFRNEGNVDNFGVLFCPDGVILSCQADMANEQEVKMLSDFGAALAIKMKGVLVEKELSTS